MGMGGEQGGKKKLKKKKLLAETKTLVLLFASVERFGVSRMRDL